MEPSLFAKARGIVYQHARPLEIRAASSEETQRLITLWKQKSAWWEMKGAKVWNLSQFSEEALREKYDNPVYYICCENGEAAGGFILIDEDRRYWPDKKDDRALYLHKFMVCNGYNGKGYAKVILDWVKQRGLSTGRDYIRLDYDNNREKIAKLYTENGFKIVELIRDESGKQMAKAEYRIERAGGQ